MAGVNKVIILGHLGLDPEVRTMPNGVAVANIRVATSETWVDKNTNERREITEWHRIVLYRRQAEVAGEYLRKGSQVYIEGRLRTRKWQDQNGQERYTTEIQGDVLQMLGSRGDNQNGGYQQPQQSNYQNQNNYGGNQYQANPTQNNTYTPPPSSMPPLDGAPVDDDIPF